MNRDRIEPQFPTMERHGDGGGPRLLMGEQIEGGPLMGEQSEGGPLGGANLDLNTAATIIQQQQEQISALLQQQEQLQSQATSLLGPAFSTVLAQQPSGLCVCVCVGGGFTEPFFSANSFLSLSLSLSLSAGYRRGAAIGSHLFSPPADSAAATASGHAAEARQR